MSESNIKEDIVKTKPLKILVLSLVIIFLGFFINYKPIYAKENILTIDLTKSYIIVDTTYDGSELLAFGISPDNQKYDIIVLMTGPRLDMRIYTKQRKAGVWINSLVNTFRNIPSYYFSTSSSPIDEIINEAQKIKYGLDFDSYALESGTPEQIKTLKIILTNDNLYSVNNSSLISFNNNLFKVPISLPSLAPTGLYTVEVLAVVNGVVTQQATSSLWVRKEGIDAFISKVASEYGFIYGLSWAFISAFIGISVFFIFNFRKLK